MDTRYAGLMLKFTEACRQGDYRQCLELLDRGYVQAVPADREALRAVFRSDERLDAEFGEQLATISRLAAAGGDDIASLRACLLSVSMRYHFDSRDVLLGLEATWKWALGRGIDPRLYFEEIAEISSPEETHVVGGSAQGMLFAQILNGVRARDEPFTRG